MNLLLQQTERHGETVNGGGRCWRAAGDPNINGDNGVAAAPDAVEIVENTAADTARAVGNTDFMIGADSYARSAGIRIARVTAPVNNKISA